MKEKKGTPVRRYEDSASRLENRGYVPPSREYVDALVRAVLDGSIEACWHSAVDPSGRALFPSKVYPNNHPQANLEAFHYLIKQLHAIGRPVLSWYSLRSASGVAEAHPDWRMVPMAWDGHAPREGGTMEKKETCCCFTSPYAEMLVDFAVEIVRDVGFDGIWFDGSMFTLPKQHPACRCEFCSRRFKRETGEDLPEKVNFDDRRFRIWINWRYDVLMEVWRKIVAAVTAIRPDAVVCFNNYRRRTDSEVLGGWCTGIPLRPERLDAIMAGEFDGFPGQADVQMKINRAYEFKRGVESWWGLANAGFGSFPDVEVLPAVQAALGCVSAGGVASCGTGTAPAEMVYVVRAMQEATRPRMPWLNGRTVEYAAILASQQTMDFWGREEFLKVWDAIHGANELLRHAHLQSSVIFDGHLQVERLRSYPALVLGNAACLSTAQAEQIRQYVEAGGVFLACYHAGEFDELGYPHERPVLDDLLGIRNRTPAEGQRSFCLTEGISLTAPAMITVQDVAFDATVAEDAVILAGSTERRSRGLDSEVAERGQGVWKRKVGKGWVVFSPADLFRQYLRFPTVNLLQFVKHTLVDLVQPAVRLEAPLCVSMNVREQADGRWAIHLHNAPGSSFAYPYPPGSRFLYSPGEVNPVYNLTLTFQSGRVRSAVSAIDGKRLEVKEELRVYLPELQLQEIIEIRVGP